MSIGHAEIQLAEPIPPFPWSRPFGEFVPIPLPPTRPGKSGYVATCPMRACANLQGPIHQRGDVECHHLPSEGRPTAGHHVGPLSAAGASRLRAGRSGKLVRTLPQACRLMPFSTEDQPPSSILYDRCSGSRLRVGKLLSPTHLAIWHTFFDVLSVELPFLIAYTLTILIPCSIISSLLLLVD